ncbi:MAG: hypothetical protein KJ044_05600 [Planctomycetes bacterium]|nr:hypothetical protein [Planctomycetota bacterium]
MKTTFAMLTLAALLAPALAADLKTDLDAAARAQPGDHAGWVKARDRVIAHGQAALPEVRQAAAPEHWTAEGWMRALVAEVARLRLEKPELARTVDEPRGLDPAFYGITRLGKPYCRREFAQFGVEGVPLLLERWRFSLLARPFSEGEAGVAEKEALATSLLQVPGQVGDTRARFAMLAALRDTTLAANWRQDAAVSYGQTGGEAAIGDLAAILDDARQPLAVREGCAWAIGRVPSATAVEAYRLRLEDDRLTGGENGPALVRAMLNGVGILGSAWGWKARGADQQEKGDRIRNDCARLLVDTLKRHPAEHALVANGLVLVELKDSLKWLQDLAADTGASPAVKEAALQCSVVLQDALARVK